MATKTQTKLARSTYAQILGCANVARVHNECLEKCAERMKELLCDAYDEDLVDDVVFNGLAADELLERLGIEVAAQ